ncbi:MAG: right-handed parallel beta-helix repeat-containing protein [Pyrinomonadaceae bacterium]|nr:right-handed parallel beta-helix repeat-containing protein [Sphingobacteriaceae bacterium]
MKQFSKAIFAMFLSAAIVSSCKKASVDEMEANGSSKGGSTTSALRTIYVNGNTGSDASTNPFSSSTPYKTLQKAADITLPGDDVMVMSGTYIPNASDTNPSKAILDVTRSGTASNYITYKLYPGASAVIHTYGRRWNAVVINASYIKFDGIEVKGNNNNTPGGAFLDAAKASQLHYRSGATKDWARYSEYCTNGISVGGQANVTKNPHHVEIRNCKVHDLPGGGIGLERADYVTMESNTVYNTCWFGMYGNSGISVFSPTDYDSSTGYRMRVSKNKCYNNYTQVPYVGSSTSELSDGNGIIVDQTNFTSYTGRTLVENNICYKNGGGGVHLFKSSRIDVMNNTLYANEQVLGYANMDARTVTDSRFLNNIVYAKNGGKANDLNTSTAVTFNYTVYYNGTVKAGTAGANSITANPSFVNAEAGDFWLNGGSPAINAGVPLDPNGVYPFPGTSGTDITWRPRIKNGRIDCGAYEVN